MTYTDQIPQTPLHVQVTNLICPELPRKRRRSNINRELPPPLRLNFDDGVEFNVGSLELDQENEYNLITPPPSPRANFNEEVLWAPRKNRRTSVLNEFNLNSSNLFRDE